MHVVAGRDEVVDRLVDTGMGLDARDEDLRPSRRPADIEPAWDKMRAAGMLPTSSEQALLELVQTAEAAEFKTLQRLLKDSAIPRDRD